MVTPRKVENGLTVLILHLVDVFEPSFADEFRGLEVLGLDSEGRKTLIVGSKDNCVFIRRVDTSGVFVKLKRLF